MAIYNVFVLAFVSTTAAFAARIALSLYALELGASALIVGAVGATFSALPMLLSFTIGRFTDRFGPRSILIWLTGVGAIGMSLPYLLPSLAAIFAAAALAGLTLGGFLVALQNVVGIMSEPHKRTVNFSNFTLLNTFGMTVGPLIAGFAIDHWGAASGCLLTGMLSLLTVPILLRQARVRNERTAAPARERTAIRELLAGAGVVKSITIGVLLNVAVDVYQIYIPVYGYAIGFSASTIGAVVAVNSLAMAVVRLLVGPLTRMFGEDKTLAYSFFLGGASLLVIPLLGSAWTIGAVSLLLGMAMGCCGPISLSLMFASSADGRTGEAMGLRMSVLHLSKFVGPVLFGTLASAVGLLGMFVTTAVVVAAGGVISPKRQ